MVGTNAKMIAIRMVRSKLRKRDETSVRQDHVILHSAQQNNNHCHHNNNNSGAATSPATANGGTTIPTVSATVIYPPPVPSPTDATTAANGPQRQFIWQIPATHPYVVYNNDKVNMAKFQLGVGSAERSIKMWHFWGDLTLHLIKYRMRNERKLVEYFHLGSARTRQWPGLL
jgi:hypothetical protein